MSSSQNHFEPPRVSQTGFLALTWSTTIITLVFLVFRLAVRIRAFRKLYADDICVILSWLMLLASTIIWQIVAWRMYEGLAVATGAEPLSIGFLDRYSVFLYISPALGILFNCSIWTVKLSFLLFFKRLGSRTRQFKVYWWIVLITTIACWVPTIADVLWQCVTGPVLEILVTCTTPAFVKYSDLIFIANTVLDLFTDLLIISIPVSMLWRVRIPLKQKMILMMVFSAAIFIMVVAIIRVSVVIKADQQVDQSWLFTWTYIEWTFSLMIACVASFRQLFVASQNSQKAGSKRSHSIWSKLLALTHSSRSLDPKSNSQPITGRMHPDVELGVPQPVHVQRDISISIAHDASV